MLQLQILIFEYLSDQVSLRGKSSGNSYRIVRAEEKESKNLFAVIRAGEKESPLILHRTIEQ
jgi:hypothetical protein